MTQWAGIAGIALLSKPEACTTQTRHISGQLGITGIAMGVGGWQYVKERGGEDGVAKIDVVIVKKQY